MNDRHLILFVKAPAPGSVKTRLSPVLSPEESANLYRGWAEQTYSSVRELGVTIKIAYEPHPQWPAPDWISSKENPEYFYQAGHTLGERLADAFRRSFDEGARRVVAIGSDSPGLPVRYIAAAFDHLQSDDVVLGPAKDGGYYLVGLSRYLPILFEGIPWSTPQVLNATVQKAEAARYLHHILPEYFDIDVPEDLMHLADIAAAKTL